MTPPVVVIVNPAGGTGRAHALASQISRYLGHKALVVQTQASGDEQRLVYEAVNRGVETIVAVGGDGTCGGVADAILRSGASAALAVVPAGTGNDFAKILGVASLTITDIAHLVAAGTRTRIDVGRADGHYFINSCGFGFDASVLEASAGVKFLRGEARYIYAALRQLLTYRGSPIAVNGRFDEAPHDLLMVTVSNGPFLGGAFHIAPQASVLDGRLDVCVVRDANVLQRIRLFASALRGTHGQLPSVRTFRTGRVSLTFPTPPAIELDGELRRARTNEVTIECVPRALNVIAAEGARL